MRSLINFSVWFASLLAVPLLVHFGGQPGASASFVSALFASIVIFLLFCPFINSLQAHINKLETELDAMEPLKDYDDDIIVAIAGKPEVHVFWEEKIEKLFQDNLSEPELILYYRRTLAGLIDIVDPYFAEEVALYPISEILRLGNRLRCFSFRRFCRKLGK